VRLASLVQSMYSLRGNDSDFTHMPFLKTDFFSRDAITVARDLIGTRLVVGRCEARIVETEAYTTDAASHAVTRRHQSLIMQQTFGYVYVYFIYGMYYCLNFTADQHGPGAVLIRAAEPLAGIDLMKTRRKTDTVHQLASGPGKLCQALAIDLSFNRKRIGAQIKVKAREGEPQISTSTRVGISQAIDLHWRFFERGNQFVSGRRV
jgi:DNA-3-methyladenine glycosylase